MVNKIYDLVPHGIILNFCTLQDPRGGVVSAAPFSIFGFNFFSSYIESRGGRFFGVVLRSGTVH